MPARPLETPPLCHTFPDSLMDQAIRGNVRFPQTHAGQTIMVGNHMMTLMLEDRMTWDDFAIAPTDKQIDKLGVVAQGAHERYRIRQIHVPESGRLTAAPAGYQKFGRDMLRATIDRTTLGVMRTVSNYVMVMIPDLKQSDMPPYHPSEENIDPNHRAQLDSLFSDEAYRKEASALGAMWSIAASSLQSAEGKNVSACLQDDLRGMGAPIHLRQKIGAVVLPHLNTLGNLVLENLTAGRAVIDTTLGGSMPETTIRSFVLDTVFESDEQLLADSGFVL